MSSVALIQRIRAGDLQGAIAEVEASGPEIVNIGTEPPLVAAVRARQPDIVAYLLRVTGINANQTDASSNFNALHHAVCDSDSVEMLRQLIESDTDKGDGLVCSPVLSASPAPPGDSAETPLSLAVRHDRVQVVRVLLAHPLIGSTLTAKYSGRGDSSQTLLMIAAAGGRAVMLQMLLAATTRDGDSINVNHVSGAGLTALHAAVQSGSRECVRALLKKGADKTIKAPAAKEKRAAAPGSSPPPRGSSGKGSRGGAAAPDEETPLELARRLGNRRDIEHAIQPPRAFTNLPAEPNLSDVLTTYPNGAVALCEFHDAVLRRASSELTVAERELIAAYVSLLNACSFCFDAHATIASVFGVEPTLLETLVTAPPIKLYGGDGSSAATTAGGGAQSSSGDGGGNNNTNNAAPQPPTKYADDDPADPLNAADEGFVPRELKPLLKLVRVLTLAPNDLRALHRARCACAATSGVSDSMIHDTVMVCSLFSMMNRIVAGHGVESTDASRDATRSRHQQQKGGAGGGRAGEQQEIDRHTYVNYLRKIQLLGPDYVCMEHDNNGGVPVAGAYNSPPRAELTTGMFVSPVSSGRGGGGGAAASLSPHRDHDHGRSDAVADANFVHRHGDYTTLRWSFVAESLDRRELRARMGISGEEAAELMEIMNIARAEHCEMLGRVVREQRQRLLTFEQQRQNLEAAKKNRSHGGGGGGASAASTASSSAETKQPRRQQRGPAIPADQAAQTAAALRLLFVTEAFESREGRDRAKIQSQESAGRCDFLLEARRTLPLVAMPSSSPAVALAPASGSAGGAAGADAEQPEAPPATSRAIIAAPAVAGGGAASSTALAPAPPPGSPSGSARRHHHVRVVGSTLVSTPPQNGGKDGGGDDDSPSREEILSANAITDEALRTQFDLLDRQDSGGDDERVSKDVFRKFWLEELEDFGLFLGSATAKELEFESMWTKICGRKRTHLTFKTFALFMLKRASF